MTFAQMLTNRNDKRTCAWWRCAVASMLLAACATNPSADTHVASEPTRVEYLGKPLVIPAPSSSARFATVEELSSRAEYKHLAQDRPILAAFFDRDATAMREPRAFLLKGPAHPVATPLKFTAELLLGVSGSLRDQQTEPVGTATPEMLRAWLEAGKGLDPVLVTFDRVVHGNDRLYVLHAKATYRWYVERKPVTVARPLVVALMLLPGGRMLTATYYARFDERLDRSSSTTELANWAQLILKANGAL